jgi:hypothetical protein
MERNKKREPQTAGKERPGDLFLDFQRLLVLSREERKEESGC